ncbi:hypothetical protein [Actinomadura luteofluorescens]|uniref:hypothetical protein n=1 Tax=Actinomadura luteofluorescens TaxID=46163 RepID=UPI0030CD3A93
MTKIELGRLGIWRPWPQLSPELARDVEELGYGTVWIGGSPAAPDVAVQVLTEPGGDPRPALGSIAEALL